MFWTLFSAVITFALGVQFAYSQSGGFPTTPSSGVYHTSSEVVCNDCITSANIQAGGVGTDEIANNNIMNDDISSGAGIHTTKINGDNGWHAMQTISNTIVNDDEWYVLPVQGSGMPNGGWANTRLEIICDDAAYPGINSAGGMGLNALIRYNHKVIFLNPGSSSLVYSVNGASSNNYQYIELRPSSTNSNLEIKRQYSPGSNWQNIITTIVIPGIEPKITALECLIKLI